MEVPSEFQYYCCSYICLHSCSKDSTFFAMLSCLSFLIFMYLHVVLCIFHCPCFHFVYFVIFREKVIPNIVLYSISGIQSLFVLQVNSSLVQFLHFHILCICLSVPFLQTIFVSSLGHLCFLV